MTKTGEGKWIVDKTIIPAAPDPEAASTPEPAPPKRRRFWPFGKAAVTPDPDV